MPQGAHARRWLSVGRSTLPASRDAAAAAARVALDRKAKRDDAKLLLVFCSDGHDLAAISRGVNDVADGVPVAGCSTAGEICHEGPSDGSVVVVAFGGAGFHVSMSLARDTSERPRDSGASIAACARDIADSAHKVLMLIVDGAAQEQEEIVRGVYGVVGASMPLVGGCAAASSASNRPAQLFAGEVLHDAAIAIAIGSDAPFGIGIHHGWRKVGEPMVVTSSHKGWLRTLDDRPALDVYLERFNAPRDICDDVEVFESYAMNRPVGIRRRSGDEVRGVNGHTDFAAKALYCGGEISQGSLIWCMEGNADTMLDAADQACRDSLDPIGAEKPLGLLVFDCSGRREMLGDDGIRKEVGRLVAHAAGAPVAGFYSFGEIARVRGISGFHHQTLVVLAVS